MYLILFQRHFECEVIFKFVIPTRKVLLLCTAKQTGRCQQRMLKINSSTAHYFHKTTVFQLWFLAQNIKPTANGKTVQWSCTHPIAVRHLYEVKRIRVINRTTSRSKRILDSGEPIRVVQFKIDVCSGNRYPSVKNGTRYHVYSGKCV